VATNGAKFVRCTGCEFDNREGRKFCASCGLALPATCPECGHANEGGDRYCGCCGRLLADTGVAPPVEGRSEAPEGDRRPVSVLFCDLVGYTRLSSELDPEDVHALLERFFTLVDAIVDRFGGTIDKHVGDAAMALFGAPVAHGNDAERAVRAAMQIHASLSELNSSPALAAHIGVATARSSQVRSAARAIADILSPARPQTSPRDFWRAPPAEKRSSPTMSIGRPATRLSMNPSAR
jgi:Adenylate and Guanylate cyclase catalytic domain